MTADSRMPPPWRVYAELPSGEYLVPGQHDRCPGVDQFGACTHAGPVAARPCRDAVWHYAGEQSWRFEFRAESSVCPAVVLDPLGPTPVPLD